MTLSEIAQISQAVSDKVGGRVVRKEFIMTNKNIYVLCYEVNDINDFLLWLNANSVVPILVISKEEPYQLGDKVEPETNLFVPFINDVYAIQGDKLLRITDGFVTIIQELEENAL